MDTATSDAKLKWLAISTWASGHPADEGRFYHFVLAAWQEYAKVWPESEIYAIMSAECRSLQPYDQEARSQALEQYCRKGTTILDFLEHTHVL